MATQGTPELHPLDLGEKLDVGVRLWTRNFKQLMLGALIVVVPLAILSTLLQASVDPDAFSRNPFSLDTSDEEIDTGAQLAATMINFGLTMIASAFALAALTKAIADAYTGHPPRWRESVLFALKRLHSVLWLGFLSGLGVALGLLTLGIVSVWLFVAWSVALVVLLVEGERGTKALGRSFRLVRNRWWATFGTLLVAYLLITIVQLPLSVILGVLFSAVDSEVTLAVATTFLTIVGYSISLPLGAAITALIYFDLRIRKEGFDLELLAQRIGHPDGAIPSAIPLRQRKVWTPAGTPPPPPATYGGFAPPTPPQQPGWGPQAPSAGQPGWGPQAPPAGRPGWGPQPPPGGQPGWGPQAPPGEQPGFAPAPPPPPADDESPPPAA